MVMTEETRNLLNAKKAFEKRGHKATLVQNTDRYTVIDWRKADGSGDYYVNYIIDKKRGSLIISGDLGDCIATWYNPNSVHNITEYIRSVGYFIGKFQCSSDRFNYDDDAIIAAVEEELKDSGVDFDDDDFKDDWEEFQDELPNYVNAHGFFPNGEVLDFLDKYLGDDWWNGSDSWGRSIDPRVSIWPSISSTRPGFYQRRTKAMRILIDILAVIGALTVSSVVILVIALIFDTCDQDDFDD